MLDLFTRTMMLFMAVSLLIGAYFLVRIEWLVRSCRSLIRSSISVYQQLPSFEYMLYARFWVWDLKKFLPKENTDAV